jgi:hypothetical protein
MTVKRLVLTAAAALVGLPAVAAAHPPRVVVGVGPFYPRPYYYPRPAVGIGLYVPPPVVVVPARPVVVVPPPVVQVVPVTPAVPIPAPPSGP